MRFVLLLVFISLTLPIRAWGDAPEIINPPDSGLNIKKINTTKVKTPTFSHVYVDSVDFDGQTWISANAIAEWAQSDDQDADELQLLLIPDDSDITKLPHFGELKLANIVIKNTQAAISKIFGKDVAGRLSSKQLKILQIHGRFLIQHFETGIACEEPWATADMASADVSEKFAVLSDSTYPGCS